MKTKQQTVGQWLEELAWYRLHGGGGTVEFSPMPIQSAAKILVEVTNKRR